MGSWQPWLMKSSSSMHLHEGFMATIVYAEPRQRGINGFKGKGPGNKGKGQKLAALCHVRTCKGIRMQQRP